MQGVVAYTHNPSTRESETGGPPGTHCQPGYCGWWASSRTMRNPISKKIDDHTHTHAQRDRKNSDACEEETGK